MRIRFIFSMVLCWFGSLTIVAQDSDSENQKTSDRQGVVISSDPSDKPDQSAILHIKNQEGELAGVKFPEKNFSTELSDLDNDGDIDVDDLYILLSNNVNVPQNGLLFYVAQENYQGFYYYDENANKNWLEFSTQNQKNIGIPDGTIIQFAGDLNLFTENGIGKKGTSAEGWYICNGKNNTPDLTASFIKGLDFTSNPSNVGVENIQSSDYKSLTSENLPQHTHDVQNFTIEGGHSHEVNLIPHKQAHWIYSRNAPKVSARKHNEGNHTIATRYAYEENSKERDLNNAPLGMHNTLESTEPKDMKATLVEDANIIAGKWLADKGGETPKAIDNRPSFFVVVYIMKIEKPGQSNNYLIK